MLTCKINVWNQCDFKMGQVVTKKKKKENPTKRTFDGKLLKERVAQNDFDYSKVYAYSIFIC